MYTKRGVGELILLTVVTCGFYGLYWSYVTIEELGRDVAPNNNAAMDILFSFVTCGVYSLYLLYRHAEQVYQAKLKRGMMAENKSLICVLMAVFGVGIVSMIIIQQEMNDIADFDNSANIGQGQQF